MKIDFAPTIVEACQIYQASKAVNNTAFSYIMATEELDSKDVKTKLRPGLNNLERAGEFATKLTAAVDLFESRIHSYNRCDTEKDYPEFVDTYLELLSEVEDYYGNAKASIFLDTVEDKVAKMLKM